MVLTIASGKGGTGKTTVAVNLAWALAGRGDRVRLLDCDVEEPNDHLFVRPAFTDRQPVTVPKPVWNEARCTGCGQCADACRYHALAVVKNRVLLFPELCHACGVCSFVCPEQALTEQPLIIGQVESAAAPSAPFFFAHGVLNIAESLAPRVVQAVKQHVDRDAITIVDAAPGTACPVVAAVAGADVALLVTEPTPFGLHDLRLAVGLTLRLGVPTGILINRSDGQDRLIDEYARETGLPIVGRIPFRRDYAEAYSRGEILVEAFPELRDNLLRMFDQLAARTVAPPPPPAFVVGNGAPPFPVGRATSTQEITVISGKGGTGKTTLVASLARLAAPAVIADVDVDAADLHLLLAPVVQEAHAFAGGAKAVIAPALCAGCGKCTAACRFDAIRFDGPANDVIGTTYRVDPVACEGCGLCQRVCPCDAIRDEPHETGHWYVSHTTQGPLVHAQLGIAEENSGRLVTQVRDRAAALAAELRQGLILADGPPGTACPVIASVSGTDLALIVTEPTVSGVHDLERVLKLTAHFQVPALVVINKADLNPEQAARIEQLAGQAGGRVLARIPFDPLVNGALMAGRTVIDNGAGPAATAIRALWTELQQELAGRPPS